MAHDADEAGDRRGTSAPTPEITPDIVRGEVRDFLRAHEQRRRQLPRAIVIGVLAGLTAVAFTRTLAVGDDLRTRLIERAHGLPPWGFLIPVVLGAFGAGIAVWLVRAVAPEASGSGIPHLEVVLHHMRPMRGARILMVKFLGGIVGIGAGLALGREGPTIQMGGVIGQLASRAFRSTARERQTLIAAGAGAGLAAAFNAPLAGLVFVLEEVQRDFAPAVFTATLIAAVTADLVTRLVTGQLPVFHVQTMPSQRCKRCRCRWCSASARESSASRSTVPSSPRWTCSSAYAAGRHGSLV